ncbi:MAG: sulfatase, partial [Halobacteriaceae archaeon]
DRESPFLLVAGFENPHNICEWIDGKPPAWGSVPEAPTEECPTLPANFHPPPGEPDALRPAAADSPVDFQLAGRPDDVWRHYRHVYYRLVERVDREVGRVLDALDSAGVADETVVVFTSDHGDSHGAHGLGHKMFLYEESARVPFVVRDPAGGGGRVDDSLVSNGYDLLPTLCDYAGIDPPADLPGRSVRPLVRGGAPDWREYLVARAEVPLEGRMVRTDRYKYVVYEGGRDREQLFDLRSDRGEMVDLSADADHAGTLDAHRAHLLEWCRRTDDTFAELSSRPGLPSVPGYEYDEIAAYMAE